MNDGDPNLQSLPADVVMAEDEKAAFDTAKARQKGTVDMYGANPRLINPKASSYLAYSDTPVMAPVPEVDLMTVAGQDSDMRLFDFNRTFLPSTPGFRIVGAEEISTPIPSELTNQDYCREAPVRLIQGSQFDIMVSSRDPVTATVAPIDLQSSRNKISSSDGGAGGEIDKTKLALFYQTFH